MRILAGDLGGTKTALGLYERGGAGEHRLLARRVYASTEHHSLEQVLAAFLGEGHAPLDAAAFGVAGPVVAGRATITNLPWMVSAAQLQVLLGCNVALVNDFHAVALGVTQLADHELHVLQQGRKARGEPFAVIGAGTGLGEAIGVPTPQGICILAGEGGHCDFAPRDELEIRLLRYLAARHGRVSVERVVSGLGLTALYDFVVADGQAKDNPATRRRFEHEPVGAVIAELACDGGDPAAAAALALFVSLYGAQAGNLALTVLPQGGLFVAGGIAPKLVKQLADGAFLASFLAKGRMSKILETIHVAVVLQADVGLLGARAQAELLLQ
ncbi:MAG TPA: glucokinase [Polyangiales bacterium]